MYEAWCTNVCGLLRVYAPASVMCIRVRLACRCCSHASILEQSIHQQRVRHEGGAGQHPVNAIGHVGDVPPVNRMFHLSVSSGGNPCTGCNERASDDVPVDEF